MNKMRQLHELMAAEGMTETVSFMEKNFEADGEVIRACTTQPRLEQEPQPGTSKDNQERRVHEHRNNDGRSTEQALQSNINQNHKASNTESFNNKGSIETIYRDAVEKRISSSSEEGMDIPNDSLVDLVDPAADAEFQSDYEMDEQLDQMDEDPPAKQQDSNQKARS